MRKIYSLGGKSLRKPLIAGSIALFSGIVANAQYCNTGGPSSTSWSNVESAELIGVSSSINYTGCPGVLGVEDQTAQNADVTIGNAYMMEVLFGTCSSYYDGAGTAWIDWNQDGVFDASEIIGTMTGSTPQTSQFNFTVPANAQLGATRLRLMQEEFGALPLDPCGSFNWGSVTDFTITVNAGVADDAALAAILNPTTGCGLGQENVEVTLTNPGTNTINDLNVSYQVNGGAVSIDTLTNINLVSGGTYNHVFSNTSNFTPAGTYTITAWVNYALDQENGNDTAEVVINNIPVINQFPYLEDFENGNAAFVSGGGSSSWEFGTPNNTFISGAASGDSAWVTNLTGAYNNSETSWVESPCYDMSSYTVDPSLRFSFIMNGESCCDEAWVEISTDAGQTWSKLGSNTSGTTNWYNDAFSQWWDGDHDNGQDWITAEHVLTGLAGESSVKIRWRFDSDGSITREGVGFDDVTISTYPEVALGPDDTLCADTTYALGLGNGTYEWVRNGVFESPDSNYTFGNTIQSEESLMLTYTNSVGFSGSDTVNFYYVPPVNLGADAEICNGEEATFDATILDASGPMTSLIYNWSNNNSGPSIDATAAGTYSVTVTDASSGCVTEDEVELFVNPNPVVDLGADTAVCEDETLIINAGMWNTYDWNNGSNSQEIIVDQTGTYDVNVSDSNGCVGSDGIIVTVNPTPIIEVGNDTMVGAGYIFDLDAGLGYNTYLWSNNTTDPTTSILADEPKVIFVRVVDAFGCVGYDEFRVDIALGAEELHNGSAFNVFPNPAKTNTQVAFELKQFADVEITVMDIQGRVVLQNTQTLSQGSYNENLDLNGIEAGTYILTLKVNGEIAAQSRVVKM